MQAFEAETRVAADAAREAGRVLLDLRGRTLHVTQKADRTLQTEADLAAEAVILRRIRASFPGDAVVSEESPPTGDQAGRRWIVDPLDGTSNFTRGLPLFAVSVAFWEGGSARVGVVYLPLLDELFVAAAGAGATLNGQPIRVSRVADLAQATVHVYFDRRRSLEPGLELLCRVARRCEGRVKILGSTASVLAYIAAGRLDAYLRPSSHLWDFAAGVVLVAEAGGRVTDLAHRPLVADDQSLLATNGLLHARLPGPRSG